MIKMGKMMTGKVRGPTKWTPLVGVKSYTSPSGNDYFTVEELIAVLCRFEDEAQKAWGATRSGAYTDPAEFVSLQSRRPMSVERANPQDRRQLTSRSGYVFELTFDAVAEVVDKNRNGRVDPKRYANLMEFHSATPPKGTPL
jgi:hypothetical protein